MLCHTVWSLLQAILRCRLKPLVDHRPCSSEFTPRKKGPNTKRCERQRIEVPMMDNHGNLVKHQEISLRLQHIPMEIHHVHQLSGRCISSLHQFREIRRSDQPWPWKVRAITRKKMTNNGSCTRWCPPQ